MLWTLADVNKKDLPFEMTVKFGIYVIFVSSESLAHASATLA